MANVIATRGLTSNEREVFFVQLDGWDSHSAYNLDLHWQAVELGLSSFVAEMKEQGLWEQVALDGKDVGSKKYADQVHKVAPFAATAPVAAHIGIDNATVVLKGRISAQELRVGAMSRVLALGCGIGGPLRGVGLGAAAGGTATRRVQMRGASRVRS